MVEKLEIWLRFLQNYTQQKAN